MISHFYLKTFSYAILYVYRVSFLLIQKKMCRVITLERLILGCEQMQPPFLELNANAGAFRTSRAFLRPFLLPQEQPLSHTMQNKAPVPTSTKVKLQSTEVHQEGQQTKGHFPC